MEYFDQKAKELSFPKNQNLASFQPKLSTNMTTANNSQIINQQIPNQFYSQVSKSVEDLNLPEVKDGYQMDNSQFSNISSDYVPRLVDRSIKLPINKNSQIYPKVKGLIKEHMEYSGLELDFHKLELSKDHVEAAIYYLRNIHD